MEVDWLVAEVVAEAVKPPFASHLPQHQGFAKPVVSIDLYKKGPVVFDPGLPASDTLSGQLLSPNVSFVGAGYYLEVSGTQWFRADWSSNARSLQHGLARVRLGLTSQLAQESQDLGFRGLLHQMPPTF